MKTGNKHGMNWVKPHKRLAIYMRDGMCCLYCGGNYKLTLDHLCPRSRGGSNHHRNLITACMSCNVAKGDQWWLDWLERIMLSRRLTIRNAVRRKLQISYAKTLLSTQTFRSAVHALKTGSVPLRQRSTLGSAIGRYRPNLNEGTQ